MSLTQQVLKSLIVDQVLFFPVELELLLDSAGVSYEISVEKARACTLPNGFSKGIKSFWVDFCSTGKQVGDNGGVS